MYQMDNAQIDKIDKNLQNRDGCAVMDAFDNVSFPDQLRVIKEIESRYDPNKGLQYERLHDATFGPVGVKISADGELLFKTTLGLYSGSNYQECKTHKYKDITK